jgi:hypothetical protein
MELKPSVEIGKIWKFEVLGQTRYWMDFMPDRDDMLQSMVMREWVKMTLSSYKINTTCVRKMSPVDA